MAKNWRITALVAAVALVVAGQIAQAPPLAKAASSSPFTKVFDVNANGAMISFGNNLMTCSTGGAVCTAAKAGTASGSQNDNNYFAMTFVDQDTDPTTFNSSSSALNLPAGAQVLFARLYWGARLTAGTSGNANNASAAQDNKMLLKPPGSSSYQTITGTELARNTSSYNAYQSYADVTSLVQAAGNGYYWGANVQAATGADRYAGWAITVVYTAPGLPLRNLTVYQGFNTVSAGNPQTINVSGFKAPTAGTVDVQLTMLAYEGDISQTGDYTRLNNTQLATVLSPGTNFMNSAFGLNGVVNTTRDPADRNLFGFDIKNIGASGAIANSATSATFTFSSNGDVYYPGMVGLAINLYAPDFTASTKSVVNTTRVGDAMPGDVLQYTLFYTNTGQDWADNAIATDDLPANVAYVPGSLSLTSTSWSGSGAPRVYTDASGDDGGEFVAAGGSNGTGQVVVRFGRTCPATDPCPSGGTLQIGDAAYIQFQVQVLDSAGGTTVSNLADLNYTTHDTKINAKYTTPPASVNVGYMADVAIDKTMVPDPPQTQAIAGAPGTTTLTVTNVGPNPAKGVVITDPLPADYMPTSVTYTVDGGPPQSCGALPSAGGTVTCALASDLPVGAVVVVTIKGKPSPSSTATSLSNIATVTTSSFDPDMSNNVDTVSLQMVQEADVAIAKSVSPASGPAGSTFTYTLTATNNGPSDAHDVDIYDSVDNAAQLVLLSATGGTGVTCPSVLLSPVSVHCSVNAVMEPGDTATVTVTAFVPSNVAQETVVGNTGGVSASTFDPVQPNNIAHATVTVGVPSADLVLVKTGPTSAVIAGNRASFTMTVTNKGPSDSASTTMSDWLPVGIVADGSTTATSDRGDCTVIQGVGTGTSSGGGITCDIGVLPGPRAPGSTDYSTATITITGVLVPADFSGSSFANTASVPDTNDPNPGDNEDEVNPPTPVDKVYDLAVTKTANVSRMLNEDQEMIYTVTVTNNGPSQSEAGTLTDVVPAELSIVSVGSGCTHTGNDVTCDIPPLMSGTAHSLSFTITVVAPSSWPNGIPTSLVNTATVSSPHDTNPANDTSSWTNAGSQADLAITKVSSGIVAGASGLYTLVVTNNGPSDAATPVVTDAIPAQLSIDALPSECVASGQDVTCTYPDAVLNDQETWTIQIPVTATDPNLAAGTQITNTATVTSTTPDPTTTNNTASVTDTVESQVDVKATIQVDETGPYNGPGSTRDVTIVITNIGPSTATGVQFTAGPTITALVGDPGLPTSGPITCIIVNRWISCTLTDPLEPGQSQTLTAQGLVAPSEPAKDYPACNPRTAYCEEPGAWVTVTEDQTDANPVNNHDTAPLNVGAPRTDLHIEKAVQSAITNTDAHPAFVAGGTFAYTIDVWVGPDAADAQDVTVDDTLPAGLTVTQVNTGAGTCTFSPATQIHCDLGKVPGLGTDIQKIRITVYGVVDPAHGTAEAVPNTAIAESSTPDLGGGASHVESTANVDIVRYSDLELHKLVDAPVTYAGNSVGYTLTTINNGPSEVQHAVITDRLPLGLTLDTANSPACWVDAALTTDLDTGQQVVVCAVGTPFDPGDLSEGGIIAPNASATVRIVATTNDRDLRPTWCVGHVGDPDASCPEILPPADLSDDYPRPITNTATVTSQAIDQNMNNNTATADSVIDWLADIAVTSSASTTTPSAGTDVVTTLTGVNMGPSSADNPEVDVTWPPGWTILKSDGTPCDDGLVTSACTSVNTPALDCTLSHSGNPAQYSMHCVGIKDSSHWDTFTPGVTLPGNVTVHIPADAPAGTYTIDNQAYSRSTDQCALPPGSVPRPDTAGTCESDYSNNSAPLELNVVVVADTTIVKELVEPDPLIAGRSATYRLTVTNNGPSVAHDVVISDAVPGHLTYVDGTIVGGSACPEPVVDPEGGHTLNCEVGSLDPGESASALVTFAVDDAATLAADPDYSGELCNSGIVGSTALDPNIDNNTDEACGLVIDPPVLTLVKAIDGGPALPNAWVLTADGPTPITGASGDGSVTSVAMSPGSYTLSEGPGPQWYDLVGWVCEDSDNGQWTMDGADTLTLGFNDVVTCTATNRYDPPAPWLELVKVVAGGPAVPGDWVLSANGPTPITGTSGAPEVTRVPVVPGSYTLSEGSGPRWYDLTGWVCVNQEDNSWAMTGADTFQLSYDDKVTCTATNTFDPTYPVLTLLKDVVGGGPASAVDWVLTASGPTTITGTQGAPSVTNASVTPGTYTLSEGTGPQWYDLDGWECVSSQGAPWPVTGNSLVLDYGDAVSCTATNRYDPPAPVLTLVKSVVGGPAAATDWVLKATGTDTITGVSGDGTVTNASVGPGTYALSEETGPQWYDLTGWACVNSEDATWSMSGDSLSLDYGDQVTCTATNTYDPPAPWLELVKSVVGGPAAATDWVLSANGPTPITGVSGSTEVTRVQVNDGDYTLSEVTRPGWNGPQWYVLAGWVCSNATDSSWSMTGNATLTLGPNDKVTCTATNTYDPPPPVLTLVKEVDGGPASPTDWELTATGPTTITGAVGDPSVTGVEVVPGDYTLSEGSGPQWYVLAEWECADARDGTWAMTGSHTLTLRDGDEVTCKATNRYDPPAPVLTLVKVVDGGPATVTDWPLTATGPTTITGVSGAAAVTDVAVGPGHYTLSEGSGPQWYDLVGWVCVDPNSSSWSMSGADTLTLAYGDQVTCTATNRFDPTLPVLTLVKSVNGGTALPTDWSLTATGPDTVTGLSGDAAVTGVSVTPGDYTVSEGAGPLWYVLDGWVCVDPNNASWSMSGADTLTLAYGDQVTCTATNRFDPTLPVLTLVKSVNGGTALPTDWSLTATGPDTVTGLSGDAAVTGVDVDPGAYTLSEGLGPQWYDLVGWVCVDPNSSSWSMSGADTLTLAYGDSVTCTATNTYNPPTPVLTLVKVVDGGPATIADWPLTATGPTAITGVSGTTAVTDVAVGPGAYTLSEGAGPQWYDLVGWSCVDPNNASWSMSGADTLTLAYGDQVTCTATNTYNPPTPWLTLVKVVDGGSALAGDWELSAVGPVTLTGASGAVGVTRVPVGPGGYTLSEGAGPQWYDLVGWVCVNSEDGSWSMQDADSLELSAGDKVTCTATNTYNPPTPVLTLVVEVDGGTADPQDWLVHADGIDELTGHTGVSGSVGPGTYTLAQSDGPEGYVASGWTCVNGDGSAHVVTGGGTVALGYGETVTCTIVNTYTPPPTPPHGPTSDTGGYALSAQGVSLVGLLLALAASVAGIKILRMRRRNIG
ncbi:MAG: DUF11 domain-containing protein [Propionibacteriaceae bacterium]|nr:DUF11 domain-containing protein [Propionibacteriaceae bacterium]